MVLRGRNMSEAWQIASLLIIVSLIGGMGLMAVAYPPKIHFISGDVAVAEYEATFYLNGTLLERYTYRVDAAGKYRMLYRVWDVPLTLEDMDFPSVEVRAVSPMPQGTSVYAKDYEGRLYLSPDDLDARVQASRMAYLNEVGVFKPDYYGPGVYQVNYTVILHSPIEYDDELSHLNLKFASNHLSYESVVIVVKEAAQVEEVFLHPPTLRKERVGNELSIRGACPQDQLLEVELLLKKEALSGMKGFPQRMENVKVKTRLANLAYMLPYYAAMVIKYASYLIAAAIPAALSYVYWRHGMERRYVTPKYLSHPPVKRKPWLVNLVFNGDIGDFDENGLYATLLDLHAKGKLKVRVKEPSKGKESGLQIQVLDPRGDDE
jgi:uncharacterized membrane protein